MTKAKKEPFLSDSRLHDIWNVRPIDHAEGELKDFDRLICSAVARCLNESQEPRSEQAETLSFLLGERVSAAMLETPMRAEPGEIIRFQHLASSF